MQKIKLGDRVTIPGQKREHEVLDLDADQCGGMAMLKPVGAEGPISWIPVVHCTKVDQCRLQS